MDKEIQQTRIISHRGNLNGKEIELENSPEQIKKAIDLGFDVEIDLWCDQEGYSYLGHDLPQHQIDIDFLIKYQDKLLIHCKNAFAVKNISGIENEFNTFFHWFTHENDRMGLTSFNNIITGATNCNPDNIDVIFLSTELFGKPFSKLSKDFSLDFNGIITDYPIAYYEYLNKGNKDGKEI